MGLRLIVTAEYNNGSKKVIGERTSKTETASRWYRETAKHIRDEWAKSITVNEIRCVASVKYMVVKVYTEQVLP